MLGHFSAMNILKLRYVHCFFRCNAVVYLIDCSISITFIRTEKPKNSCDFFVIFALFFGGLKPKATISLRFDDI